MLTYMTPFICGIIRSLVRDIQQCNCLPGTSTLAGIRKSPWTRESLGPCPEITENQEVDQTLGAGPMVNEQTLIDLIN